MPISNKIKTLKKYRSGRSVTRDIEDMSEPFCGVIRRKRPLVPVSEAFSKVAEEWCYKRNAGWGPEHLSFASQVKAWWICSTCKHEWKTTPASRTGGRTGCPSCSKVLTSFISKNRALMKPDILILNPDAKISRTWYENYEHDFTILSKSHPKIAKQWHPTKNGEYKPKDFATGSKVVAWWQCKKNAEHVWQMTIKARTSIGRGQCPFCVNQRVCKSNTLKSQYPAVAKQWHSSKNGSLTTADVVGGSNKKVWWKCPKGPDHEWQAIIETRTTRGVGCPFCSHRFPSLSNNLLVAHPEVARSFHPTKNGDLKPENLAPMSMKKIWWQCQKNKSHEWQATAASRSNGTGCPFCSGRQLTAEGSLQALKPNVAVYWHKTKNRPLSALSVSPGSGRVVWWQCKKKHIWQQKVDQMVRKEGRCALCK